MTRPVPSGKQKLDLTPLPIRVSPHSIARLHALRDRDGVTIQEHVRRAIDEYLDRREGWVMDLRGSRPTPTAMKAAAARQPDPSADGETAAASPSRPYSRLKVK